MAYVVLSTHGTKICTRGRNRKRPACFEMSSAELDNSTHGTFTADTGRWCRYSGCPPAPTGYADAEDAVADADADADAEPVASSPLDLNTASTPCA